MVETAQAGVLQIYEALKLDETDPTQALDYYRFTIHALMSDWLLHATSRKGKISIGTDPQVTGLLSFESGGRVSRVQLNLEEPQVLSLAVPNGGSIVYPQLDKKFAGIIVPNGKSEAVSPENADYFKMIAGILRQIANQPTFEVIY